jgi:hypothetical protein
MNLQALSADKQYEHGGSAYQQAITLNPRFCSTDSEDLGCCRLVAHSQSFQRRPQVEINPQG